MAFERKSIYSPIPLPTRGRPCLIGGDPKNGEQVLYPSQNGVVVRSLKNPIDSYIYTEHKVTPTVARYAPSGFYIASGDMSGTVRIWDTVTEDRILKLEIKPIAGQIFDIAWSPDSKRVVVVGDGRETYGAAFFMDGGSSVGEITGHSKTITTCDFKQSRPFRVVTGSDDLQINWFEGPPFKYKFNHKHHQRFVNCVRFSPSGDLFLSVGQDKQGFFYDGKTAEKKHELAKEDAHKAGIYCCSWKGDGTQVLTSSGDKTCKIWDVETGKCVTTFNLGTTVDFQQLGCLWQGDYLVSLGLNGNLNYLDPNSPAKPTQIIQGHNKWVTAMSYDKSNNRMYTGSLNSIVCNWDVDTAANADVTGSGHSNQVTNLAISGSTMISSALDDSVRFHSLPLTEYSGSKQGTDGPVCDCDIDGSNSVAASMQSVYVYNSGNLTKSIQVSYQPLSVAIKGSTVAVGGDDNKVHVYNSSDLSEKSVFDASRGAITALTFSNDGALLASGDKKNEIIIYDVSSGSVKQRGWCFHTAKICGLAFNEDNVHLASASLDSNLFIWDLAKPMKRIQIPRAHHQGANKVCWINSNTLASCGQDCAWKTWNITFH